MSICSGPFLTFTLYIYNIVLAAWVLAVDKKYLSKAQTDPFATKALM